VALILLTAGTLAAPAFAATVFQDKSNQSQTKPRKHLPDTSTRRQVASTKGSKHVQRTIIFVGGKKSSQGAATTSNPTTARKSNGTLNPQPIPPGKQRQPE
jgi:phage baseplate assembly protein gpV